MKIAISLPDDLFRGIEACARRQKLTRSGVIAAAAREYLERHSPAEDATVTIRDVSPSEREVTVVTMHPGDGYSGFYGLTESTATFRVTR